ncbi:hypothetical protein IQ279_23635 [Streptomyces verrucosisporus]|uniref:DUF5753 domain-containing protein n=1 Tax=Streptomyces verrucosisporus TaxID=1695161 RepID=UPI0019D24340|nr:DUF5753 domain-containing protein [Streptomyces verrucosisporus]MBN3932570.1 hypothetical protein [Streptomyces verrucosisporus]
MFPGPAPKEAGGLSGGDLWGGDLWGGRAVPLPQGLPHQGDGPDSPVLWTLLDESILRRPIGGRGAIAEQLEHIAEMGRSGRVRVHVLPFSAGAHALLESMVILMRFTDAPPVAYVEGLRTGRVMDGPDMVEACQSAYDLALGDALSSEDSLALLETVSEEYKR